MAPLTIPDILRWDPEAIYDVFRIAKTREGAFADFGTHLQRVQNTLADWGGDAGEAFHHSMSRHRQDIDQDGHESRRVAAAVDRAEQDVEGVRIRMMAALSFAKENHLHVADDGTVTIEPGFEKNEAAKKALAFEQTGPADLTFRGIMASANRVDDELAAAIRAAVGDEQLDDNGKPIPGTRHDPPPSSKLTPEQQDQVGQWTQYLPEISTDKDNGLGDCSRWAIVSALANQYGVRDGPNGPEINLPPDVQNRLMGGMPLHFRPTKAEINRIASRQYQATDPREGFQGAGPNEMSGDLTGWGIPSMPHASTDTGGLVRDLRADLLAGHSAILNGAFPGSVGHFISVTGIDKDGNFLVNDSNRLPGGGMNGNTLPRHATAAEIEAFFKARLINSGGAAPGYSTVG